MSAKKSFSKCMKSAQWARSGESAFVFHCVCGAHLDIKPRLNPTVGGQVLAGWNVKIPTHNTPSPTGQDVDDSGNLV